MNNIRRVAHEYGSVTVFRAYMETSTILSPRTRLLRSELQSSGVSLIDCPHNGSKDVADKMIIGTAHSTTFNTTLTDAVS